MGDWEKCCAWELIGTDYRPCCEHAEESYFDYETGHTEYECTLFEDGGICYESQCPLVFKIKWEEE